jgi:hypothetical protein
MSSSRANASAVQRRTNNASPPMKQVQNTRYSQQPQQHQSIPNPKLSVSDAIALTTIRLAKVETFINNLPPLDQIEAYSNQQQSNCMITENVFNSIVSRLDKLENPSINNINNKISLDSFKDELKTFFTEHNTALETIKEELKTSASETIKEELKTSALEGQITDLKEEIQRLHLVEDKYDTIMNELQEQNTELKNMILFLQNYTLKTNQKLSDIIFHQDNIQLEEEQELSQHIHNLLNVELKQEEEEDDEPISASITEIEEEDNTNNDLNINI